MIYCVFNEYLADTFSVHALKPRVLLGTELCFRGNKGGATVSSPHRFSFHSHLISIAAAAAQQIMYEPSARHAAATQIPLRQSALIAASGERRRHPAVSRTRLVSSSHSYSHLVFPHDFLFGSLMAPRFTLSPTRGFTINSGCSSFQSKSNFGSVSRKFPLDGVKTSA